MKTEQAMQTERELVHRVFKGITGVQAVLLTAAALVYPEPFTVAGHALSDLGCPTTPNGMPNHLSLVLFSLAMITTGALFMSLRNTYISSQPQEVAHREIKVACATMGAVGSFVLVAPHTHLYAVHSLGAGLFVGALWGLDVLYSIELWREGMEDIAVILQLILQLTVLTYAVLYAANSPNKQIAQKAAVGGLTSVSVLAARCLRNAAREQSATEESATSVRGTSNR